MRLTATLTLTAAGETYSPVTEYGASLDLDAFTESTGVTPDSASIVYIGTTYGEVAYTSQVAPTGAGAYVVFYKVIGDDNHNDSEENSLVATIEKAEAVIDLTEVTTLFVYNGKEQSVSGAKGSGEISYENNAFVNVGEHVVIVKSAESGNYKAGQVSVDVTVEKADVGDIVFENATFTYDGEAKSIFVENHLDDEISVTYYGNGVIDAGSYVVRAKFA